MKIDVVKVWNNPSSTGMPYTLKPVHENSEEVYCILVNGMYFLLGGKNESLFICDLEYE